MNRWQVAITFSVITLVGIIGTGFLGEPWNNIDLWVQQLGWGEENLESPIATANVGFELAKRLNDNGTPEDPLDDFFENIIDECSFSSEQTLEPGLDIICKLTDDRGKAIAEGKKVLGEELPPGQEEFITITQTAFDGADDVQNVKDVKIIAQKFEPCECSDVTVQLRDPATDPNLKSNPLEASVKQKGKNTVIKLGAIYDKVITCKSEEGNKCTSTVIFTPIVKSLTLNGIDVDPKTAKLKIGKASVVNDVFIFKPARGVPVVDCNGPCTGKPITSSFASLLEITFPGKKDNVDGEIGVLMTSKCTGLKGLWFLSMIIDNGKFDIPNSDFDGDGEPNKTDKDDYDPAKT